LPPGRTAFSPAEAEAPVEDPFDRPDGILLIRGLRSQRIGGLFAEGQLEHGLELPHRSESITWR
jgi:hypothetical protein